LTSSITHVGKIAVGEDLLADEGREGLGIVLKTRFRVVGGAEAAEGETSRVTSVVVDRSAAESTAGVLLTLAPLISRGQGNGIGINGAVGGACLSGNKTSEERKGDG